MRDIKFRAWHKDKKCWLQDVEVFEDGSWDGALPNECTQIGGMVTGYTEPECVLMQYTGLKDKNGKEIYEGDIVQCPQHPIE